MNTPRLTLALSALALAAASFAADAAVVYTNLGTTGAPPATLGGHPMQAFNQAPQAALAEFSTVSVVPGNPVSGDLTLSPSGQKFTASASWGSAAWPGGYAGAIYFIDVSTGTLTLPPGTQAFYLYTQGNAIGTNTITVTTDAGTSSGPIPVYSGFGQEGATGFGFHTTAGESIASITINTSNESGFAVGEFGINGSTTTCASSGYTGTKLTWCKNICEMGYTGATLDIWIHRWINKYRDLPYCMQEETPPPAG